MCISSRATKFTTKVIISSLQNFCHTHRDRHFPEIVKSGHHKTCKSIKNHKSKIFTKRIFFSLYIEESKNRMIDKHFENCSFVEHFSQF